MLCLHKHAALTNTGLSCSPPGRTVSDSMGETTPCSPLLNPAQGIKVKRKLSAPGSKLQIQGGISATVLSPTLSPGLQKR